MKTLIIFNERGEIILQRSGAYVSPAGIQYLETIVPDNKVVSGINPETHEPIYDDIYMSENEKLRNELSAIKSTLETLTQHLIPADELVEEPMEEPVPNPEPLPPVKELIPPVEKPVEEPEKPVEEPLEGPPQDPVPPLEESTPKPEAEEDKGIVEGLVDAVVPEESALGGLINKIL